MNGRKYEYGADNQPWQIEREGSSGFGISMIILPQWCPSQTPILQTQDSAHTQIIGKPPAVQYAYSHADIAQHILTSEALQYRKYNPLCMRKPWHATYSASHHRPGQHANDPADPPLLFNCTLDECLVAARRMPAYRRLQFISCISSCSAQLPAAQLELCLYDHQVHVSHRWKTTILLAPWS